jgi:hypothetical protein
MKAEDFGALETAKLLNGPFKSPHCSLSNRFNMALAWTQTTNKLSIQFLDCMAF